MQKNLLIVNPGKARRIRQHLMRWYATHQRRMPWRETRDPYRIWLSEVMLQQTQVKTVIPYYHRFLKRFPTIQDLACGDLQEVLKMWEGLGYYARARNFHRAAGVVTDEYDGCIPDRWEVFIKLAGVGEYTASAVQSLAFGHPHAVVDGNVKRVLARLFLISEPVNKPAVYKELKALATRLMDRERPGTFNQAIMELGALVCKPASPECGRCPVQGDCGGFQENRVNEFPKKERRKPVPTVHMIAGVIRKKGNVLITRRKPEGLLGGLWEFPGGELQKGEDAAAGCVRAIRETTGLKVEIDTHITRVKHAYTHFKIWLDVFYCRVLPGSRVRLNGPVDFHWIRLDDLDAYAFPKANIKFMHLLK
jgi:A/G-specific adenine glycosylase